MLQIASYIGHECVQLRFHLVKAVSYLLLQLGKASIHGGKDSCRGGFCFPLRVGKLERDLTLAGHRPARPLVMRPEAVEKTAPPAAADPADARRKPGREF